MAELSSSTDEFVNALTRNSASYGVKLDPPRIERLTDYYRQLALWNARLHLVAPCSPTEFATRHVLESLLAISYLTQDARVADIGSGAGLPIIPCLIVRTDLRATLIESSTRKSIFLREALRITGVHHRSTVIAERFEKQAAPDVDFITCRALDRFELMFEKLLAWSLPQSRLLLYGGRNIRERIERNALGYTAVHIPESEQRFLFIVEQREKI